MNNDFKKYKRIFIEPNINDTTLKNNLICLKDFEYYENKTYNPMFMRTLANTIYAINSIYMDCQNNKEKLNHIFNNMPFGFGEIENDDDNMQSPVLYTISNEEHFYKSLNDKDFLSDLENELTGKIQDEFSYRKEGSNLNNAYSGIIYEENVIFNIKNIVKKNFEELPNLIFYIKKEKIETIDKISKLFDFELIHDDITNATIQIQPKFPYWSGLNSIEDRNGNIINKNYYGYNELDFVFLNKQDKIIEPNRMYCNILKKGEDIVLKKDYAYFIEIKLSFPDYPEKQIKQLFKRAKNLYLLYKIKYNLNHLGIILVYDSIESIGNRFCENMNIIFSNQNIDFQIIYLQCGVQVSNMNFLINKISEIEDDLKETKKRLKDLENNSANFQIFQNNLFSNLIEIFPDKKEILLSVEENMRNSKNQNNMIKNSNEIKPKAIETDEKIEENNNIIISPSENAKLVSQIPVKNEVDNLIDIKNNENNDMENNIENQNNLEKKEETVNIEDKENNFYILSQNSFKEKSTNLLNNKFNHNINNYAYINKVTREKINFNAISDRFKKIVSDFIDCKTKNKLIKENINKCLDIFKELNEEISNFNNQSKKSFLTKDTNLKKYLSNSLFSENTHFLDDINKILKEVISKNDIISKEFMRLQNLLFGYKIDYSPLFYKERELYKSFIKQYIYNTVFLLERDSAKKLDTFYSSLLKSIIELISKVEIKDLEFFRFIKFCLLVFKNSNYSIEQFISNFVEGMNKDNEVFLVERQNAKLKKYLEFIQSQEK